MSESIPFWVNWDIWIDAMLVAVVSAGTLAYLGIWVTLKKITYVPLALSQVAAVGVVLAFLLHESLLAHDPGREGLLVLLEPVWFSFLLSVASAFYFARPGSGGDRPVVIAYLIASAVALVLGGFTRQDIHDVRSILFGHVVLAQTGQVVLVSAASLVVISLHVLFYRRFLFGSFDPDTAGAAGHRVYAHEVILYMTLAIMLSASTRAMGAMPAFGLTVLPALVGLESAGSMRQAISIAVGAAVLSAFLGYYLSFRLDLPAGACMLLTAAGLLFTVWLYKKIQR